MRFPLDFVMNNAKHMIGQRSKGRKRYPTVLMLEPLYTCNLACIGCSTERHTGKLKDRCRSTSAWRRPAWLRPRSSPRIASAPQCAASSCMARNCPYKPSPRTTVGTVWSKILRSCSTT